jgi:hypothetical protein
MPVPLLALMIALEAVLIAAWITLRTRRRRAERARKIEAESIIDLTDRLGEWSDPEIDAESSPFAPLGSVGSVSRPSATP